MIIGIDLIEFFVLKILNLFLSFRFQILSIYLSTTYCNPYYKFPFNFSPFKIKLIMFICKFCGEIFNNINVIPRILKCGHTFCEDCIK